jgi:hypothetical protein
MLLIWTRPALRSGRRSHRKAVHRIELADDLVALDEHLDQLNSAARAGTPLAVKLYAGRHYLDEPGRQDGARHIPAHPSDRPQPELLLTLGAGTTPLYWTGADGRQFASKGPASTGEPRFRYLDHGQETSAPAWSLIPAGQARDALREFHQTGGQQPRNTTWQQT